MASTRRPLAAQFPDFPWDTLAPAKTRAAQHPDGWVDLSMGTPIDSVPESAQVALTAAADAPGYPLTQGTADFRESVSGWLHRYVGVSPATSLSVIPTLGLKEAVAGLPSLLGCGPEHRVVVPELAYPTYEVGAVAARAQVWRTDDVDAWAHDESVALVWVNSPANPTGRVLGRDHLRNVIEAARNIGAVVASDECYLDLWWGDERPHSVLSSEVCGSDVSNILALHSLSKRSNLAGYRVGSITGDHTIVETLLAARKHLGLIVPAPTLAAAAAAYRDDQSVQEQRARYRSRRHVIIAALHAAGFRVDHSEASLFVWATADEDCWTTVDRLAQVGVLVAPGSFYGPSGERHIRVALTASDIAMQTAAERLTTM